MTGGTASQGHNLDTNPLLALARSAWPGLPDGPVRVVEHGQNSVVLDVDSAFIVRAPRYVGGTVQLAREVRMLHALGGRLPLPVPEPLAWSDGAGCPDRAFLLYRRLPGEPLWPHRLTSMSRRQRAAIAEQLAGFLLALHHLPVADLPDFEPRPAGALDWTKALWRRVEAELLPRMPPDARRTVASRFTSFLRGQATEPATAPVHHDFGASNILYDAAAGRITGILDFASTGLGDPAFDLAGLRSGHGPVFFGQVARRYGASAAIVARARFYAFAYPLEDALVGLDRGDRATLQRGLARFAEPQADLPAPAR